ncbi:MAG: hypothetical protein QM811_16725 [Pirellulales bacterium]
MPNAIDQLKSFLTVSRETLATELKKELNLNAGTTWRARWDIAWAGLKDFISKGVESFRGVEGFAGVLKDANSCSAKR